LIDGAKLVFGMLGVSGAMLLTTSSSIKEVDKVLGVSKKLIEVVEAEQLVSVTVVLSVTVTTDTTWGVFRVEVGVTE
jgi:hypothetical protein